MSFIAFEGIDGTGKTTLAHMLTDALGGTYYKTPPEPFASCRAGFETSSPRSRFRFYLDAMLLASHEVEDLLCHGETVVADRWVWSTLAYHFVLDPSLEGEQWWREDATCIVQPDIAFLMEIPDRALWRARLRERGPQTSSDKWLERNVELQLKVERTFRRLFHDFVVVPIHRSSSKEEQLAHLLHLLNVSP